MRLRILLDPGTTSDKQYLYNIHIEERLKPEM